ncbi:UDP-glucose 4-epimerase GalE [Nesterenkonia flava]|uniref:UDP-glucose 4-epimerase n=1 Tax=Nesterenkonia flava TaxID=469799 RepID=A0ABU1FQX7_9MICC|nr:UDP-glucose 4-epimerase GalE [Nesterenkonia flava]MDR5711055.1 UDP-glucose 4-epimerase GalE [Nesterenkonia flava]
MRILVTGGAGYIGSVVTRCLVEEGHDVVVLDDLSTGHREAVDSRAELVVGDITRPQRVLGGVDAVVHLAARSQVAESVAYPERYWHGNITATMALLEAMREAGVKKMVFSSTAAVYGKPRGRVITEEHPTAPINPYGASKLAIDHMLAASAAAHGLGAVSLRYFNAAGALAELGERHEPETHLIPNLLEAAFTGATAKVFGTDYPTDDGTAVRDYIHVADLAQAHLRALESIEPSRHEVFNLGTGRGHSVGEVLLAVQHGTGQEVEVEHHPRRAGDPAVLVASPEKARRLLGWLPERGLEEMIADAAAARNMQRGAPAAAA